MPFRCCASSAGLFLAGASNRLSTPSKRPLSLNEAFTGPKPKLAKISPLSEEMIVEEMPSPSTDSGSIDISFECVVSEVSDAVKRQESNEEMDDGNYCDLKLIPEDSRNSPDHLRTAIVFLKHLLDKIVKMKQLPAEQFADMFFPLRATLRAHERRLMTLMMEME